MKMHSYQPIYALRIGRMPAQNEGKAALDDRDTRLARVSTRPCGVIAII